MWPNCLAALLRRQIPATPGGGGVGPPTENGLSIFDPDDALATV